MIAIEYIAGVFDSEGSLSIAENKCAKVAYMQARLNIANTNLPLLTAIRNVFGGTIRPQKSTNLQNYQLEWTKAADQLKVLRTIQPFLIAKKEQVDFFLAEYAPTIRYGRGKHPKLSEQEHSKRAETRIKLQTLKQVDYPISAIH